MPTEHSDPVNWHNELSPLLEKLEFLVALDPVLDSDRAQARALSILLGIIGDYVGQLRRALDARMSAGESQEGSRS
jgi:hypothetical protein